MKQEMQRESTAIDLMQGRIADLGISQTELAARCGVHVQTLSAIMHGRRDIPIGLSVKLDVALGLTPGSIAQAQTSDLVAKEIKQIRIHDIQKRKMVILEKIKAAGGFWSYRGIPEHLDDDAIIEAALVHLELEEIPMLFQIWSRSHVKRVWKDCLVSQGRRMNILNYILATKIFQINNPDSYIKRYARQ